MDQAIIEIENLSFGYEAQELIIEKMDLIIEKGSTVGLVGANGAGKSTLMKLLLGLEKFNDGKINVMGMELTSKTLKTIRKVIGYTFQDSENQLFMPSVYEDIAFSARQEKKSDEEVEKLVTEALVKVDALHLKNKAPHQMSGGEKRLISLAIALSSKPEILMLDEPSVGLDPKSRRQLIELLKNRNESKIIATHDMDMALDLCDRIIVLRDGHIFGDDKPMKIFNNQELLKENHLEQPLRLQGCPNCGGS